MELRTICLAQQATCAHGDPHIECLPHHRTRKEVDDRHTRETRETDLHDSEKFEVRWNVTIVR